MVVFNVNSTLGAAFIGFAVACAFYGITCAQTFVYYWHNRRSETSLKLTVATMWLLDTLHLCLIAHAMYHHLVANFANPLSNLTPVWSMTAMVFVAAVLEFLVRCVFIARFWKLSNCNRPVTLLLVLINCVVLALGLYFGYRTSTLALYSQLADLAWLICAALALHLLADLAITAAISLVLWRALTGFARTDDMLRQIMRFVINAGLLTSVLSLVLLITYFTAPYSFVYISMYFLFCEVLLNSLLASLNFRSSLRDDLAPEGALPSSGALDPSFACAGLKASAGGTSAFPPSRPSSYTRGAGAGGVDPYTRAPALDRHASYSSRTPLRHARMLSGSTAAEPASPRSARGAARVKELVRGKSARAKAGRDAAIAVHVETSMVRTIHSAESSTVELSPITRYGSHCPSAKDVGHFV